MRIFNLKGVFFNTYIMYKFLIIGFAGIMLSCSGKKKTETSLPATDILMDSTQLKMKADTTVKMLDKLEDSINRLRNKAADKAGEKN